MAQFRLRSMVTALRFDPKNPPDGLKLDTNEGWFIENSPYFVPVNPGDWVLLDNHNRATDAISDVEFQETYEPVSQIAAVRGLLEACESYNAAWLASCPEGPDSGASRLSVSTIKLWKQIRAAIAEYHAGANRPAV